VSSLALKPYQFDGIEWMRQEGRALLADEAGLGKSVQLLYACIEPVLIVAPAMVLEAGTWDDEIAKWTDGIDATQVSYTSLALRGKKGKVQRDEHGFALSAPKPEYNREWGTLILDECHYIKGRKSSYSVAISKLRAERVLMATGTPIPNWAHEAFMLLRMLYPEQAKPGQPLGSYWRWAGQYFHINAGRFGGREIGNLRHRADGAFSTDPMVKPTDEDWALFREDNWNGKMKRRLREEVLTDLPPLTQQEWRCPMSAEQARAYRELKKDYVTWLDTGAEIDVWSEPGKLVKLAQVSSGLETLDPDHKPTGKFKVLEELIVDRPRQTLVVAHFQKSVEAAALACKRAGKSVGIVHGGVPDRLRKQAIRAFQAGEIDVLAASLNTISEGLTLHQGGADQVIFVERSWTPSKNEQALRRLHRIGQTRPVTAIDLVTPNSIDMHILKVLREKTDQQIKALGPGDLRKLI
jgi:SNF2 family DNA or RNA helicase